MTQSDLSPASPAPTAALYRIRVTYAHREGLRYVSHLDMHLVWERTLRRAGLPLAYSQGFSPHPRLHLASALPLGFLSRCELADFWLEYPADAPMPDLEALAHQIQSAAPPGLEIQRAGLIPLSAPALQTQVRSAEYLALPLDPLNPALLTERIAQLLAADSLPRQRRGKAYDLRPLVEALEMQERAGNQPALFTRLAAREGATGRPEELLEALGFDPTAFRVERIRLILLVQSS